MRVEDRLLLELCRSAPDGARVCVCASDGALDWERFVELAEAHQVAPLALERLLRLPVSLPPEDKEDLAAYSRETIAATVIHNRALAVELRRILDVLVKHDIPTVLMKGLSLPDAEIRVMGDLDILVTDADLPRAIAALREIDYIYVGHILNRELTEGERLDLDLQRRWNNQYQLHHEPTGTLLELHTNLFERERVFTVNLDALLDRIDLFRQAARWDDTLGCRVFSAEHALLLMCLHVAIKRSPANNMFCLRNLVDIDRLAAADVDWQRFTEAVIALRVAPFVSFSLRLARQLLGTEVPEQVARSLWRACTPAQRLLVRIHAKSVQTLAASAPFSAALYRILSPFIFQARVRDRLMWLFLIPILFPPRWKMSQKFGIREDSPLIYAAYLLNPFRWLFLLLRGGPRSRNRAAPRAEVAREKTEAMMR
jgi:hypothetical protein